MMLTTTEAQKRARVSRPTLSRALKSGDLPGIRDNSGKWMIEEADLDAWSRDRSRVHGERVLNAVQEREKLGEIERLNAEVHAIREDLAQARENLARAEGEGRANRERIADLTAERERLLTLLEARPVEQVSLWTRLFRR